MGKIGVAVSGGMDSMVLLNLYLKAGVKPYVVNVEHGIRGNSSRSDSAFVEQFCLDNGLELFKTSVNALEYSQINGISVELAARKLRYEFFDNLLESGTLDYIALAHHADDNAETMLMRIFRGTGIRGLKGIVEHGKYLRPLLHYSRSQIADYAAANDIKYVEDESNNDVAYTRNYFRNAVMPLIKQRYPEYCTAVNRLAESAAEADSFINKFIIKPTPVESGTALIGIFYEPIIIQKYSVNAHLIELGAVSDVEYRHLTAVIGLANKENNASVDLPFGITVIKFSNNLIFYRRSNEKFAEREFRADAVYAFSEWKYSFRKGDKILPGITVDGDKLNGAVVRERQDGDMFRRVNGKRKLLSDFLNEKKLTKAEKNALLVLAKGKTVLAILGLETAEEVKIAADTNKILHIIKEKNTHDER